MAHSWYITSVFLLHFTGSFSAPVRVTVESFVGDSAVFSCSIPESEIQDKIEEFSAHLRDDEDKIVCDITGGNRTCGDQDPEYKNRVEMFPEGQKKGNFTFKLNGLQNSDARNYQCYITGPSQNQTITELQVKDKPGGRRNHRGLTRFFFIGPQFFIFVAIIFGVIFMAIAIPSCLSCQGKFAVRGMMWCGSSSVTDNQPMSHIV